MEDTIMIKKKISDLKYEIIQTRRDLHNIPETAFNEIKTSEYLRDKLLNMGYNVESVARTGLIAYKQIDENKKTICFRSDIDALNILEETNLSFSSSNSNMHACGHDAHMSILMGFAKYLLDANLDKHAILLFQPAEENENGAKYVIEDPTFQKFNIESIFGLHVQPDLAEGVIGVKPGPFMAQVVEFDIKISGKSCHGAQPDKGIDSIILASQLINNFQSIITRYKSPMEPAVLTIGEINGGTSRNIISGETILKGTLRTFDIDVYNLIRDKMLAVCKGIEVMHEAKVTINFFGFNPPVKNDAFLYQKFTELFEPDELILMEPMAIAEDFGFYQMEIPGLFFMLGCRNESKGHIYPLHNSKFDFNEDILLTGVETLARIAEKL
jgi:hippurate hydrolase/N-acetyldiaminopimelate deacetylase